MSSSLSEAQADDWVVGSRCGRDIHHCKLERDGRMWLLGVGLKRFESICQLVAYYADHALYGNTYLRHPVNRD
eukprot:Ihof_evm1s1319 gene=Ihof_evmTU1s1319